MNSYDLCTALVDRMSHTHTQPKSVCICIRHDIFNETFAVNMNPIRRRIHMGYFGRFQMYHFQYWNFELRVPLNQTNPTIDVIFLSFIFLKYILLRILYSNFNISLESKIQQNSS